MDAEGRSSGQVSSIQELRAHVPTGNAAPLLQEIATALARLLETGQPTTIDLGVVVSDIKMPEMKRPLE